MVCNPRAISYEISGVFSTDAGLLIGVYLPKAEDLPGLVGICECPLYGSILDLFSQINKRTLIEVYWSAP
jgi:hypothetical protein